MRGLYEQIEQRLEKLTFEELVPGFCRYEFAIYDETTVYLKKREIPVDGRFLGNTAIEFENGYLAIYAVPDKNMIDVDELTAQIVHEMFHVHQKICKVEAYPDDFKLMSYPGNLIAYQAKYAENQLLVAAYEAGEKRKEALFASFLTVRECRKKEIGAFLEQEECIERLEGMAEYAGTKALLVMAPEKGQRRIAGYLEKLREISEETLDIRRMSYWIGTIYFLVKEQLGNMTQALAEALAEEQTEVTQTPVQVVMERDKQSKIKRIREFLEGKVTEETGDYCICGYDPMNMFRVENQIFCAHFVSLRDAAHHTLTYTEPVLLYLKEGTEKEVVRIARRKA